MLLAGWITQAQAQWSPYAYRSMARGAIGHSIHNPGMSGKKDDETKIAESSFSYPMGRDLKVYSGGGEREGWNAKSNSGGEGFWVLSKAGGAVHGSYAGPRTMSADVQGRTHAMTSAPEAYVGVVEEDEWALNIRTDAGAQAANTLGATVSNPNCNWWPASNNINAGNPPSTQAAMIWNYRFQQYNSGQSYASRVAAGEFPQYSPPAWAAQLSEDDFPEQIAIAEGKSTASGLQWRRTWHQWGSPQYDKFLIVDNVIENTSSSTVQDIYIVLVNRFTSQQANAMQLNGWNQAQEWARDDYARCTLSGNYLDGVTRDAFVAGAGKPAGLQRGVTLANNGHAIVYAHDGESDNINKLHADVGDPYQYSFAAERMRREQTWVREGMIQHGQYFGLGTVDAFAPFMRYGGADDETYVNPHDNPATPRDESANQPASVLFHAYRTLSDFDRPTPLFDSNDFIYDAIANTGIMPEPTALNVNTQMVSYGPYTLAPGQKAKVVLAYVVGLAADHAKYSDYKRWGAPFNMSWMNLYGGKGAASVKFEERQKDIPLSEDVMFDNFERAIGAYEQGYDIPNQPPSIKIAWDSNLQGKTQIRWSAFGENSADPDYTGAEAQDLRGYRIYRSNMEYHGDWEYVTEFSFADVAAGKVPAGVTFDATRTYTNVKSAAWPIGIPLTTNRFVRSTDPAAGPEIKGTYTYDDAGTNAGFPNWYSVRYYDSGHSNWKGTGTAVPVLESSQGISGGAIVGATTGVVPVVPGAALFDALEVGVKVVPNPFKIDDDLHTYNRQQNMRFINLPGRCQIDIYDVTGMRVWTFFNNDPLKGEVTYIQLAENRPSNFGQAMLPGAYFWKVTSLMPGHEGKTQAGTFVIIK